MTRDPDATRLPSTIAGRLAVAGVALLATIGSAVSVWINDQINHLGGQVQESEQRDDRDENMRRRTEDRTDRYRAALENRIRELQDQIAAGDPDLEKRVADADTRSRLAEQAAEDQPPAPPVRVVVTPPKPTPAPPAPSKPKPTPAPTKPPLLHLPPLLP